MATKSMASYPHIEINVIDESIYQYSNTRILPLQRDLFTVRAQKGRVGVLAWYDQYIEAETALGAETFNELNETYSSNDALFIKRVMENNGCFIVRLAEPESLKKATTSFHHDGITERLGSLKALQILEAVVESKEVPLYERYTNGTIKTDEDGNPIEYRVDGETHVSPFLENSKSVSPDNPSWYSATAKTTDGTVIDWRWRYAYRPQSATGNERESLKNMQSYPSGTATVYPMIVFEASSPGCWGNDNCLEFFYDSSINSRDEAQILGNVQYTLKPHYKVYGESTINSYFDKRGNNAVSFVMEPGKIDKRYESQVAFTDVLDDSYDLQNPLPWDVTFFDENWKEVCEKARATELKYYKDLYDKEDSYNFYPKLVKLTEDKTIPGNTENDPTTVIKGNIDQFIGKRMYVVDEITVPATYHDEPTVDDNGDPVLVNGEPVTHQVEDTAAYVTPQPNTIGVLRIVTANDVGKYVAISAFHNEAGDGIADSDTDGSIGIDTFYDKNGNPIPTIDLNEIGMVVYDENGNSLGTLSTTQSPAEILAEQTAYYNAINDMANDWMMNIVSGINLDGNRYVTVRVNQSELNYSDNAPEVSTNKKAEDETFLYKYEQFENAELVSDVLHYAHNGKDGDLTDWGHEARIRQFYGLTYQYEDNWNPKNIVDRGRFPFNTIFDTGYTLKTKKALCDFLTVREDVKVVLSTQTCTDYLKYEDQPESANNPSIKSVLNTMAQDESVGTALQSRVQLMRESVIKGTACCRATIFAHAGHVFGNYKGIVPMTLWSAIRGSEHYNTTTMNGTCKGWPNSQVAIFKTLNWVAPDEASHERHWNLGINYVQYYDMDNLHFPSIRTVYKYDTSVLLDDEFTDAIVFVKQAARDSWATYVGMDSPQAVYEALITKDLSARLMQIFNGRYTFDVQAYQTVEEANRGYVQHVAITIESPAVKRVWLVDVICRREGYDPTAQANA